MKYTALILMLAMNQTQAAPVKISWTLATEREDGTPLYISEIAGTNLWIGTWGPFLMPVDFTSLDIQTSDYLHCFKFSTVLLDGTDSEPTEWLCLSNTPEGE